MKPSMMDDDATGDDELQGERALIDDDRVSTWWFVIFLSVVIALIGYAFTRDVKRAESTVILDEAP